MTPLPPLPRLLVSVRDVAEARAAAAGGADIIDFKEPARGPLGRADFETIAEAARALRQEADAPLMPLSAALGEVHEIDEWLAAVDRQLPGDIAWLKLGLSGLGRSANWVEEWLQARAAVEQHLSEAACWVAVAYADVEAAAAPPIDAVIAAAAETGCGGVLIDTFDKAGGRLLEHLDGERLSRVSRRVRDRGLFFAVAGRLRRSDLAMLQDVDTDIIGVRSAACAGNDRQTSVDRSRVAALRQQIHALAASVASRGHECAAAVPAAIPTPIAPAARRGD